MELKDIKDVLTFAAFQPEADNSRFTWPQRFQKKKSVIINVSRGQCSWAMFNRRGEVDNVGEADGEFIEVASQMSDQWRANTENGHIGISINNRFIISLEHNLSRKKGWEDDLRHSPKSVIGSKYDRSKRYALHHNPETSASLMLATDESMLKSIEESMRSHNLRPARICSGLFAMTAYLLTRIAADNSLKNQDLIIVTWLSGSLCIIRQKAGQWQELRCRSGIMPNDENTVAQMVKPFLDSAQTSTRVLLMEDKKQGGFTRDYLPLFDKLQVTDATEEQNIWNILGKH